MSHYTLTYTMQAVSVSQGTLQAACAAVPLAMDPLNVLGLVVDSDMTTTPGTNGVQRQIVLHSTAGPLDPTQIAPALTQYMQNILARALVTPVVSAAVVVTP